MKFSSRPEVLIILFNVVFFNMCRSDEVTSDGKFRRIVIDYDISPSPLTTKTEEVETDFDSAFADEPSEEYCQRDANGVKPEDCIKKQRIPRQIAECPDVKIRNNYNCMEMGCTVGKQCQTPRLKHRKCCPHTINDIVVSCCLAKPIFTSIDVNKALKPSCPPVPFPKGHHCFHIGCKEGEVCVNNGVEYNKCCRHTFQKQTINCCYAVPLVLQNVVTCPEYTNDETFDCLEIGCEEGARCNSMGNTKQTCCRYVINNRILNCCLKGRGDRKKKTSTVGCPRSQDIPNGYQCLEIGCEEGDFCYAPGVEGIKCCPYIKDDSNVTCCLKKQKKRAKKKMKSIEKNLAACPPLRKNNVPEHCMEIGCEEGVQCTAAGAEEQPCCPYFLKKRRISCCLPRINKIVTPIVGYPLGSSKISNKCPPTEITEGHSCLEIGCKVGEKCKISGLSNQNCCKHEFRGIPMSCCVSLPRPKGCKYIEVLPHTYNCMQMGCDEGKPCTNAEVVGRMCCPYFVGGYQISCCLKERPQNDS